MSMALPVCAAPSQSNDDMTMLTSEKGIATVSEAGDDTGHSTPDTALYLSDSYMGQVLADSATSEESWYYFHVDSGKKIGALLEQPSDGDYDIVLYSLDLDTGNLTYVAASVYGGSVIDRFSAVCENEGYYFLCVVPQTASTSDGAVYYFIVNLIDDFDSNEPNDNALQSKEISYSSEININGTIDNVFDQDWYKITVPSSKSYRIELNGVPSGAQYTFNICDENLDIVSALTSEGDGKTFAQLDAGTYYVNIASANNVYSATTTYTFRMREVHSTNSTFHTTKGGHLVEITNSAIYIDGAAVDLNWNFVYNINYIRTQKFTVTSSTQIDAATYKNGTFKDGQNINKSSDCVAVKINNFVMTYYCNSPHDSWTTNFDSSMWTYFYIDADTGKTIGTDANYYHTDMGIKNSFNRFN